MIDLTARTGETTFKATAGDSLLLAIEIVDEYGELLDLTGFTMRYQMARTPYDALLLAKATPETSGIAIVGPGAVQIAIDANDTDACVGYVYHELEITSPFGDVTTVLAGYCEFAPELID